MALSLTSVVHHLSTPRLEPRFPSDSFGTVLATKRLAYDLSQSSEDAKEKVRQMFKKVELSVSAYDTAWVAMSPSPTCPTTPCFPGSLEWILQNQLHDGSWGLANRNSSLIQDTLSSTLSCILALKTWSVGEQHITKGLDFIASNVDLVMNNEKFTSPVAFDVIFPCLIEKAIDMNVNLHIPPTDIARLLQHKDLELKRIQGTNSKLRGFYLASLSEGLGKAQDWREVMTYQLKNGSLFNSPSTTAAAFTELQDSHCYRYLCSVLQKFGNAAPTLYPADAYFRLYLVDMLGKLGVTRHFEEDINRVLSETFRHWEEAHDDIFSDFNTRVLAFRLLRQHGYDVSSEFLAEKNRCFDQYGGSLEDTRCALELFQASQMKFYPHESYLDDHLSDCKHFFEARISDHIAKPDSFRKNIMQEISDTLKCPYHATLDRLQHKMYIENHKWSGTRVLKSSLRYVNYSNKDLIQLAKDDFNYCQSVYNTEFKELQRWFVESKLDTLMFSRKKLEYSYFSGATTLFSPELDESRISWAKNIVVTTVIDDFFDIGSSIEEQRNLIQLLEEWNANKSTRACSENVEIIFVALNALICETAKKARKWQDHDVSKHVVEIYLAITKAMRTEAEMTRNKAVPTMEDYMANALISFAVAPVVLPAIYFISPKLPENTFTSSEFQSIWELTSICGRLLNDIQGFQRDSEDGLLNAVSLRLLHNKGSVNKEDGIMKFRLTIDDTRRELLRRVLSNGEVPRECKQVFWNMSKVVHFFYMKDDLFASNELKTVVKSILNDPIDEPASADIMLLKK